MSSKYKEGKTETQSFRDPDATCEMSCQSCLLSLQSEEGVTGRGGEAWKRGREGGTKASLVGQVVPGRWAIQAEQTTSTGIEVGHACN